MDEAQRARLPAACKLRVSSHAPAASRRDEPITVGVPLPKAWLVDPPILSLLANQGRRVAVQSKVLERWSDGSPRWMLLDFLATQHPGSDSEYVLERTVSSPTSGPELRVAVSREEAIVQGAAARFRLDSDGRLECHQSGEAPSAPIVSRFLLVDSRGKEVALRLDGLICEDEGPIRATLLVKASAAIDAQQPLRILIRYHFHVNSAVVRVQATVTNPRRAIHAGGFWDLGDPGSRYIKDWSYVVQFPDRGEACEAYCSPDADAPLERYALPFELYQDSSGGVNWRSPNHLNRLRELPLKIRGYRLRGGSDERDGLRATPIVMLRDAGATVAIAQRRFWERFPKAIRITSRSVRLHLLPEQFGDVHELQGGEQITEEFVVCFGVDTITDTPLEWVRDPSRAHPDPQWYCDAEAMSYLVPTGVEQEDPRYRALVMQALDPDNGFAAKREQIDEYGWRHFGDLYADHEAVFHDGPTPFVSHYNNQYDAVAGLAIQYFRSGDPRWRDLMADLANHVTDTDIYHTIEDKAAYNHGLFWHTAHHTNADLATHRTYPRSGGSSGGPSAEHNYNTGLLLHYFMTGDARAREAVIGLADWVIAMDDGTRTPFRWLSRHATGLASATGSFDYHGPGRGPGNGIVSLLNAFRLTGERAYIAKADELIRRCVHPQQDLEALNLLDAERRWYYTVFLQALGRYLDAKAEYGEFDAMFAYGQQSLVHYARWMADHEYPYLAKPEILEFPNETWPAQDMRKSEVFKYAAKHADGRERERFLERARFFFDYSVSTLLAMPTHRFTRPTVLMLTNGYSQAYFEKTVPSAARMDRGGTFEPPARFTPQRQIALRRAAAISLAVLVALVTIVLAVMWE